MKKYLVLFAVFFLVACGNGGGGGGGGTTPAEHKTITGKAAVGAYLPEGAPVELRSAPVGSTPSAIISTTLGANGAYTLDVTGHTAPYLLRVYDAVNSVWYYSFAEVATSSTGTNSELAGIANINPLSDKLIRRWYLDALEEPGNPGYLNIDDIFTSGIYPSGIHYPTPGSPLVPDNTPILLPTPATMAKASNTLTKTFGLMYNIPDLENLLTTQWVIGSGFDQILDMDPDPEFGSAFKASSIAGTATRFPDFLVSYYFYTQESGGRKYIYGQVDTTGSTVVFNGVGGGPVTPTPLVLTSTNAGVNHFVLTAPIDVTGLATGSAYVLIDGANPGFGCLVIAR